MNKWLLGSLLAAWPPGFFFAARTMSNPSDVFASGDVPRSVQLVCTDGKLPNGMPCPTAKAANNRDARTISNFADGTPLTIYADKDGKTPAIIIGADGVVHFPIGANADAFSSGGSEVISGGVWRGSPDNIKGTDAEPCKTTATATGVSIDCGAGGKSEILNGTNAVSPAPCTAVKNGRTTTITCPSGTPVNVQDGSDGTGCAGDSNCLDSVTTQVKTRARLTDIRTERSKVSQYIGFANAKDQSSCGGTDITEFLKKWYEISGDKITYFSSCYDCITQKIVDRICKVPVPI